MYYDEDRFLPTDDDLMPRDSKRSMLQDIKEVDKGYSKIKRVVNKVLPDGKYYKYKYIEMYASGDTGQRIRNAITGITHDDKVGSKQEDLYFKAKSVGNLKIGSLFYESPEQFEKHQFMTLNNEIKEKWYIKNIAARREMRN